MNKRYLIQKEIQMSSRHYRNISKNIDISLRETILHYFSHFLINVCWLKCAPHSQKIHESSVKMCPNTVVELGNHVNC